MYKELILLGGGGHCKSVIDAAESAGYTIVGILDLPVNVGKRILGYPIIGTDDDIHLFTGKAHFVVTVGQIENASLRIKLHKKVEQAAGTLGTIIASTAYVSKHAEIAEGSVVLHAAVVNANVQIGKGCIINTFANIEHDVIIGNYTHISTGVMINGACTIGNRVFVGSQSALAQGVTLVDDVVVGAASFVGKPLTVEGVYVGNPILKIK